MTDHLEIAMKFSDLIVSKLCKVLKVYHTANNSWHKKGSQVMCKVQEVGHHKHFYTDNEELYM